MDVHSEECVEGPWAEVTPGEESAVENDGNQIGRLNAKEAAKVEAGVVRVRAAAFLLAPKKDSGDKKTAQHKEDVDAGPEQRNGETVVNDDGEDGDGAEAVELLNSTPMADGGLDRRSGENRIWQINAPRGL